MVLCLILNFTCWLGSSFPQKLFNRILKKFMRFFVFLDSMIYLRFDDSTRYYIAMKIVYLFKVNIQRRNTGDKMKFSVKIFFSKSEQIQRKLQIWSHSLKKFLTKNFIFYITLIESHSSPILLMIFNILFFFGTYTHLILASEHLAYMIEQVGHLQLQHGLNQMLSSTYLPFSYQSLVCQQLQ